MKFNIMELETLMETNNSFAYSKEIWISLEEAQSVREYLSESLVVIRTRETRGI